MYKLLTNNFQEAAKSATEKLRRVFKKRKESKKNKTERIKLHMFSSFKTLTHNPQGLGLLLACFCM